MIKITEDISIDENDIKEEFIRSSGPGGQNVNKVASSVVLRFDLTGSALPEHVKNRLLSLAGRRVTGAGALVITARRFRSQEDNRRDALERLIGLIRDSAKRPRPRIKTKATSSSKRKRLESKQIRGIAKKRRAPVKPEE